MDNLTHTLVGVTLARTSLGRIGRGATSALILASNAPDVDIVATAGGTLRYLQWHRGPTHGPLGVVALGLAAAGLAWAGLRVFDRKRATEHAPYQRLALISIVGVMVHILMDLPTPYGTRILSPFEWNWYSLDLIPIIDVYLLAALIAGVVLGYRSDRAARRMALIVVAFMLANYGVRVAAHKTALTLAPRVFGPVLPGACDPSAEAAPFIQRWPRLSSAAPPPNPPVRCLVELAALPTFSTPFHWRLIARLSDGYETHNINILDRRLRGPASDSEGFWRTTTHTPDSWTPPVFTAARTEVGRGFLGFSRFAVAGASLEADGHATVRWREMRFMGGPMAEDERDTRADFFSATVRVGPDGRIVEQRLGP